MSSLFDRALEVVGVGRQRIGLSGLMDGKPKTVDLDVTSSFSVSAETEVTTHPIEVSKSNPYGSITDFVIPKVRVLTLEVVLSDNLDLIGDSVSVKDKVKILNYWQMNGFLINLEGYTTGGVADGALNYVKSGISNLFSSKENDPFYFGLDTDIIQGLVIGNIQFKRVSEIGRDVSATIELKKVFFASSSESKMETKKSASPVKNNGKRDTEPVKKKDEVKKSFGKKES